MKGNGMTSELQWLIGAFIGIVGLIGGIIARDRQLTTLIKTGDDQLHERINRTRDDYVRRDDLAQNNARISDDLRQLREELHKSREEQNRRLDVILTAINKSG